MKSLKITYIEGNEECRIEECGFEMLDLKEHRFEMQDLKTVKSKCVFISNLKMSFEISFEFKTPFFVS